MAFQATVYRILIAAPSDVDNECQVVEQVIRRWNSDHAADLGVILMPRRWNHDVVAEFGDGGQGVTNTQIVDTSDLLIGIFWHRLGSPTGKADSGTLEDIQRFAAARKPISLYFSQRELPRNITDDEKKYQEYQRLQLIKNDLYLKGFIDKFLDVQYLKDKLYSAFVKHVADLQRNVSKVRQAEPLPAVAGVSDNAPIASRSDSNAANIVAPPNSQTVGADIVLLVKECFFGRVHLGLASAKQAAAQEDKPILVVFHDATASGINSMRLVLREFMLLQSTKQEVSDHFITVLIPIDDREVVESIVGKRLMSPGDVIVIDSEGASVSFGTAVGPDSDRGSRTCRRFISMWLKHRFSFMDKMIMQIVKDEVAKYGMDRLNWKFESSTSSRNSQLEYGRSAATPYLLGKGFVHIEYGPIKQNRYRKVTFKLTATGIEFVASLLAMGIFDELARDMEN